MDDLPPLMRDQRKVDADHLRLLAIFHFLFAGFSFLGIGFLFLHYSLFHTVIEHPEMWRGQNPAPPPVEIFAILKWFYAVFGAILVATGAANLFSGLFMQRRKHRTFSLVVAGWDCLQFPFGTILGVFTFVVLLRDSVREAYETPS